MSDEDKNWLVSDSDEYWHMADTYTRDEAVRIGKETWGGKGFWIGRRGPNCATPEIQSDSIIDILRESLADIVGESAYEEFMCSDAEQAELTQDINNLISAWVVKHDLEPTCYPIVDVEFIGEN